MQGAFAKSCRGEDSGRCSMGTATSHILLPLLAITGAPMHALGPGVYLPCCHWQQPSAHLAEAGWKLSTSMLLRRPAQHTRMARSQFVRAKCMTVAAGLSSCASQTVNRSFPQICRAALQAWHPRTLDPSTATTMFRLLMQSAHSMLRIRSAVD